MALYYQMVFGILVTEIVLFLGLIIPLPRPIRKKALVWISKNLIPRVQYTLKIVMVFVFVLFIDSINRMARAQEKNEASDKISDVRVDTNINIQKFYNQRNMYLTGSTLFLSLVLNYSYSVILDLLETEEKLQVLQRKEVGGENTPSKIEEQEKEVTKLREQLQEAKKKSIDFETLKKQADQQHVEYNRLAEEYSKLQKDQADAESKKDA